MTNDQEVVGRILTNRVTRQKASNSLDINEIMKILNIFLAGDAITPNQYSTIEAMLN